MIEEDPKVGALVLYHQQAAVVDSVGAKFGVTLANGQQKFLRRKDMLLLDQGPLTSLEDILSARPQANVEEAWQLLAEEGLRKCNLLELSELIFGKWDAVHIWACYRLINETPYFKGHPGEITIRSRDEVARENHAKQQRQQQEELWQQVRVRLETGTLKEEDRAYFRDVEELAKGVQCKPLSFKNLGIASTPEDAHHFLLKHRLWDAFVNPYPARAKVQTCVPTAEVISLPHEHRRDLTHLTSWAIDDESSTDPDDAMSLEGNVLWVHIADVAATVPADSPLDVVARSQGGTLYLPEGNVPMLPDNVVEKLGLGLQSVSPALSFKIALEEGQYQLLEVCPSWIRAIRTSYEQADECGLPEDESDSITILQHLFHHFREQSGAIQFQFPEVTVKVQGPKVLVRRTRMGKARKLVGDAMVLTGYVVAEFCRQNQIPIPFLQQNPPAEPLQPVTNLREANAARRKMCASVTKVFPGKHFGLGLSCYTRSTSPLRRYFDLVVHQQLRRHLAGQPLLSEEQVQERIASVELLNGRLRQAMRNSQRHWLLVYLQQQKKREWQAILLEQRERRGIFCIEELGLEVSVPLKTPLRNLDQPVTLLWQGVDLPRGEALFKLRS